MALIAEELGLHPLAVEDARSRLVYFRRKGWL
jgi:Mg2+ and Co2+ transporter CorA